jgi:hypothetical protein
MNDGGAVGNVGIVNLSGTINVAGIIGLGTLNAVTPSGGTGFVNVLNGGVLNLSNIAPVTSIQPGSLLDISGTGKVTLPGDFVAVMEAYRDAGRITGYGGAGTVVVELVGRQTITTAIPEPVSISLLGLGALALLRKRS